MAGQRTKDAVRSVLPVSRTWRVVLAVGAVVLIAAAIRACAGGGGGGGGGADTSRGDLVGLAVTPQDATVAASATQEMTATGTYEDDSTEDLSAGVSWFSMREEVATIASGGEANGAACGLTTIAAVEPETLLGDHTGLAVSGCTKEGSVESPILLNVGEKRSAQVDATASYYFAGVSQQATGYDFYLEAMTDDLDISLYGDPSFETATGSCYPSGRHGDEFCHIPDPGGRGTIFVKVSGAHARVGSAYRIFYKIVQQSQTNPAPPASEGSPAEPVQVSDPYETGRVGTSQVGTADPSYYSAGVIPGVPVLVQLTGSAQNGVVPTEDLDLYVYPDADFSGQGCSSAHSGDGNEGCSITPSNDRIWIKVVPHGAGAFFDLILATDEGSRTRPLRLFPGRFNLGTTRAAGSYYRFTVSPGATYEIGIVTYMSSPVTLTVHGSDSGFDSALCTEVPVAGGRGPEGTPCEWTADGSALYVQVQSNVENAGAFFGIDVRAH